MTDQLHINDSSDEIERDLSVIAAAALSRDALIEAARHGQMLARDGALEDEPS